MTEGTGTSGQQTEQIEISEKQRERFERIKAECTDDGHLPEPTDKQMMESLMDTWDAVDDGLYSDGGDDAND